MKSDETTKTGEHRGQQVWESTNGWLLTEPSEYKKLKYKRLQSEGAPIRSKLLWAPETQKGGGIRSPASESWNEEDWLRVYVISN